MYSELSYAYGKPLSSGAIKQSPEDFIVEEKLGFNCVGEGEHLYLLIEKKMLTTQEMHQILSNTFDLPLNQISYAGLKDKFGITSQWFSLHLPGKPNPCLESLFTDQFRLLEHKRHTHKLQTGALKENHFKLKLREAALDEEDLFKRLKLIQAHGVPNYFGPQRFGNQESNIEQAKRFLIEKCKVKGRYLKGIYISTARSLLFNELLSYRIKNHCWNQAVDGDLMMLSGTNSVFHIEKTSIEIKKRIKEHDISPAGVLWGTGKERLSDLALSLQEAAFTDYKDWLLALESQRIKKAYRSLILHPQNLSFEDNTFEFTLPKGSYATVLLRELLSIR